MTPNAWLSPIFGIGKRVNVLFLVVCLTAVCATSPVWSAQKTILGNRSGTSLIDSGDPTFATSFAALRTTATRQGSVRIIVGLRVLFAPEGGLDAAGQVSQRLEIAGAQDALLTKFPRFLTKASNLKRFEVIPFIAVEVTAAELDALSQNPDVTVIEEDRLVGHTLAESVPLIGSSGGAFGGYSGAGQAVAVLDTGVDKNHPDLAGRIVSEACYSTTNAGNLSSTVCPGGVAQSTAVGSALPYSSGVCPAGKCDHGTHVAGITAGSAGVARGAGIIAIQVFSKFDGAYAGCGGSACALSYSSDQVLGLQRVNALRASFNIASANMSLGGGRYYSQGTCDTANVAIKAIIDTLRSNGVATVIASGNSGYSDSMGAPGCVSSAVSVGATWDVAGWSNGSLGTSAVDSVAYYSNSVSFLNLLAPGSKINAPIPNGGYGNWDGTSMATPHVAGAWAVLKQKAPSATVDQVLAALTSTGVAVTDPRNGITKPRIQVDSAVAALNVGLSYALSVSKAGSGTVSSSPAGINCGSTCSANFASGTLVTLTATPSPGASFTSWGGACSGSTLTCNVTMSVARSVSANFTTAPDFPPGGVMPTGWTQPAGSNAAWAVTTDSTYSGSYGLRAGPITNSQSSRVSYTVNFVAGNVSFARRVSSEQNFDLLNFYIDGVLQGSWSGEVPWGLVSYPITAGTHTVMWEYFKDSSLSAGSDTAWVDEVILPLAAQGGSMDITPVLMLLLLD